MLALVLMIFGAAGSVAQHKQKMNAEQLKVMETINAMVNAYHDRDLDRVMATYTQDAVIVFEPGSAISDPKTQRQMFAESFQINPKFEFGGHEVFIADDTAVHLTPWTMTGKAPDGTEISQSGLSVAVLKKQADGQWLMVVDNPHGQVLMDKR